MTELLPGADPRELVPGDPEALEELARTLARFATGMGDAAGKLRAIRAGDWVGDGGDAFRILIDAQPGRFDAAADAFGAARSALTTYAAVLRGAQTDATSAVRRFEGGDHLGAQRLLGNARERVATAARHTASILAHAETHAPHKPGLLHRALSTVEHLGAGILDGVTDMATGAWTLTGAALTDRDDFTAAWTGLADVVVAGPQARQDFAKSVLDWDEWGHDPARAIGHTLTTVAALGLGAEAAVSKAGDAAEIIDDSRLAIARLKPPTNPQGLPVSRGLSSDARYTQVDFSPNFGERGRFRGAPITWVTDQLRRGALTPDDLPVDIIRRKGHELIMNSRSSQALTQAGIDRSRWVIRDVTGDSDFERSLNDRLRRNGLDEAGTKTIRPGRIRSPKRLGNMPPPPGDGSAGPELFDWRALGFLGPELDTEGSPHAE